MKIEAIFFFFFFLIFKKLIMNRIKKVIKTGSTKSFPDFNCVDAMLCHMYRQNSISLLLNIYDSVKILKICWYI